MEYRSTVAQPVKKIPSFMQPEGSQQPVPGPYPDPDKRNIYSN
jgi:hypothetical protein